MKNLYLFTLLFVFVVSLSAQTVTDTVRIAPEDALNISTIINSDTLGTEYKVYALERGAQYFIDRAFEINRSCKFIAEGDEEADPPLLMAAIRADDTNEEWYFKFMTAGIECELHDLYLLSMRPDGKKLGWSRAIYIGAESVSLTLRDVVIDGFSEAAIRCPMNFVTLDVQDCNFRNLQHATSYAAGQGYLTGFYVHPKSVKFINNTFFACNSYIFASRGLGGEAVFEHNTIVYTVVNPLLVRYTDNVTINNNLFYAANAYGGTKADVYAGFNYNNPDTVAASIYHIKRKGYFNGVENSGPDALNDTTLGLIFDPSTRVHIAENNNHSYPQDIIDYYTAWNDTVTSADSVEFGDSEYYVKREIVLPVWANDWVLNTLDSLQMTDSPDYTPNAYQKNNTGLEPGFTDEDVLAHSSELLRYVDGMYHSSMDEGWQYKMNYDLTEGIQWPLPEDLSYTNAALLHGGTDGYAVGDLNWFPEQKEAWLNDPTDVKEVNTVADEYTLSQNYPNPFNPTTTIDFSIPKQATVSMKVFNVLGQQVTELVNKEMAAGTYKVSFDASKLTSGVYFYTIQAGDFTSTKKMMLLK